MTQPSAFYDRYHQKNDRFSKVIRRGNFTYWYILDFLHKACLKGFAGLRVLDVGCGVGTISLYLAAHGATVTGIDISARAIQLAQQARRDIGMTNVTFIRGELISQPRRYNLITCFEVLEHIPDESSFIKKIVASLKPGGRLVLSTPSSQNVLYHLGFYRGFDQEVGHVRRYTVDTLRSVLEKHGLRVIAIRQVEGPVRNLLFTTRLGWLIKFIKGPLVPMFHMVDEWSGWVFGFSDIQVIAEKK